MDILEKINLLPNDIKDFFMSNERRIALEKACFLYDLKEDDIFNVSVVEDGFLGIINLNDIPNILMRELNINIKIAYGIAYELNKNLFSKFPDFFIDSKSLLQQWDGFKLQPLISEEKAWRRVLEIEPWILEEEKEKKKEEEKMMERFEKLGWGDAAVKYERLGEQLLTEKQIKIKNSADPARPSIKNWILDYQEKMGAGKHSPIDRGNYLFHSENGKLLTPLERMRLGMILKSLDEGTQLTIDMEKETIVFEEDANRSISKSWTPDQAKDQSQQVRNEDVVTNSRGNGNDEPRDILDLRFESRAPRQEFRRPAANISQPSRNITQANTPPAIPGQQDSQIINQVNPNQAYSSRGFNVQKKPESLPIKNDYAKQEPKIAQRFSDSFYEKPEEHDISSLNIPSKVQDSDKQSAEPLVKLKSISFSPNFVATPKTENRLERVLRSEKPLPPSIPSNPAPVANVKIEKSSKPEFSLPISKPPMGTDHFDVENKSGAVKKEAGEVEKSIAAPEKVNMDDLDSLSDEMLLKLYQQKKSQSKTSNQSNSPKGFHIGPMDDGNIVNLKN